MFILMYPGVCGVGIDKSDMMSVARLLMYPDMCIGTGVPRCV